MIIYPAIDLINGQCVRLSQGDYNRKTNYHDNPLSVAQDYQHQGASWLHMVDLDAAKNPEKRQLTVIKQIIDNTDLKIQVGGGFRDAIQLRQVLTAGISRVIIGSCAVTDVELVSSWINEFGAEHIVLAIDVHIDEQGNHFATTNAWQTITGTTLETLLDHYTNIGLQHLLCTDISRDGMMQGPNFALYQRLQAQYPQLQLQASGGVSSLNDLIRLKEQAVSGAIVGRALYDKSFSLEQALTC